MEAARDPAHAWHDSFEWNNALAADAYRLDQARALIVKVRVEVTESSETSYRIAYSRDPELPAAEQGYVELASVPTESQKALQIVIAELMRVRSTINRAREVALAVGLQEKIDAMLLLPASIGLLIGGDADRLEEALSGAA